MTRTSRYPSKAWHDNSDCTPQGAAEPSSLPLTKFSKLRPNQTLRYDDSTFVTVALRSSPTVRPYDARHAQRNATLSTSSSSLARIHTAAVPTHKPKLFLRLIIPDRNPVVALPLRRDTSPGSVQNRQQASQPPTAVAAHLLHYAYTLVRYPSLSSRTQRSRTS